MNIENRHLDFVKEHFYTVEQFVKGFCFQQDCRDCVLDFSGENCSKILFGAFFYMLGLQKSSKMIDATAKEILLALRKEINDLDLTNAEYTPFDKTVIKLRLVGFLKDISECYKVDLFEGEEGGAVNG